MTKTGDATAQRNPGPDPGENIQDIMQNTELKMAAIDKIKTSCWLRRICMEIQALNWSAEELPEINNRVKRFLETADRLEREVLSL